MVEVQINESLARIEFGEWSSNDEILLGFIRAQMSFFEREWDGYAPDPDYAKARYIAKNFGGGITLYEPLADDAPENAVF